MSEQIRALEKSLGVTLFRRVGRGVVPTTVADTLRPHAERTLAAAEETRLAAQRVKRFETGTIRFGMFGTARLYAGAGLVADVLARHPGVRVELVGQNSTEVQEDLRRGRLEAAMIAMPLVESEGMRSPRWPGTSSSTSAPTRRRSRRPITAQEAGRGLAGDAGDHVAGHRLDPASCCARCCTRPASTRQTRIEVEDVEIAVELVGLGLADSVIPRGAAEQLLPRLAPNAGWVSLRPRLYDMFAIVHRAGRHPVAGRPADDRAGHQADPVDRHAHLSAD